MGRGKNISIALALLCGSTEASAEDCGESTLAQDELKVVRSVYEFCKNVRGVAINSDVICFVSEINSKSWESYKRALALYRWSSPKYFYVNSGGGSPREAMAIAFDAFINGRTLIVSQQCFSACANYWFTVAPRRILLSNAIVGWHGTGASRFPERFADIPPGTDPYKRFLANFSKEEGERIHRLMTQPPDWYQYRGADMQNHVWHHPDDTLCKEFGIRNIIRIR